MILLAIDDATARHVLAALSAHQDALRRNGMTASSSIRDLVSVLANRGQARTSLDLRASGVDDRDMAPLTLSYRDAGVLLGKSDRTVRRLVDAGLLPAVEVLGTKCVRRADLEAFVADLPVVNSGDIETVAVEGTEGPRGTVAGTIHTDGRALTGRTGLVAS